VKLGLDTKSYGSCEQWRTQKIIMGGIIQWHMLVICTWCVLFVTSQFDVIHVSKPTFWRRFSTWFAYASTCTPSPLFLCRYTEYKLSALQVWISEENKLNATTQQFTTAKTSGYVSKRE